MLKRKLDETVDDGDGAGNTTTSNGQSESDDSNCSAGSTDALAPEVASGPSPPKRMKKKVNFKGVTVYYFPRRQGFTCVPSEGGSTLGMSEKHSYHRDFTLSGYTKEQKRIHRTILAEQRRQGKMFPSPLLATTLPTLQDQGEDISSDSESDSEYDDYYFLQPLPIRQRRVMLRTAGVKKIDNEEKDECRDIRVSRNVCGCDCKMFCDPATCSCSQAGIQCQVDRLSFPCGCTKDGCSNAAGRIEFNPIRVRTHFIHTLMRLELERKDKECPEGNSAAATTSSYSPSSCSSSPHGEIDVVGANGEEGLSLEAADAASDDNCSGASTDGSTQGGKLLKSKLKSKKSEAIDLNMFNSNERGSCRDCQNTDMCNVMMHDVKFSMVTQQQRQQQQQQQRVMATTLGSQPGYPGSPGPQMQQHHPLSLSPGISLLHPPPPPQQQQQSPQHMLLFNDGEEEVYQAENTTSMYFDNDDNSYSEMNETSSDVLESRPFASLSQSSFSGKFHLSPSQMFTASITTVNSSSSSPIHSQSSGMSSQSSLLNPSCIQSLQVNGVCRVSSTATCPTMGMDQQQQQSCGLLTHRQSPAAGTATQSLLRPPFLPGVLPSLAGQCGGSSTAMTSSRAMLSPNGPMARTVVDNTLELEVSENNLMLQGSVPSFQSKFAHSDMMETTSSSYKLESQSYGQNGSSVAATDYMNGSNHISFSSATSSSFGSSTIPPASSGSSHNFEALPSPQLPSCWRTSITSPTLRECFVLGTQSSLVSSSSGDQQGSAAAGISNSTAYQQEPESCAITASPASPNSSITTYATMTATTRDRLAAHCPSISSHMDSRSESSTSALKDPAQPFSTYHIPAENSDTSSLVGSSQNLLYDMSYTESSLANSCSDVASTHVAIKCNNKSSALKQDTFSNEKSETVASSEAFSPQPSASDMALMYMTEVSSSCLPPSFSSSTSSSSVASTLSSEYGQTTGSAQGSLDSLPMTTDFKGSLQATPTSSCNPGDLQDSAMTESTSITLVKEVKQREMTLYKGKKLQVSQPTPDEASLEICTPHCKLTHSHNINSGEEKCEGTTNGRMNQLQRNRFSVFPVDGYEQKRNVHTSVTDSEGSSLAVPPNLASSSLSPSTSTTTSAKEKEQNTSQNFSEIIKESIVEMVLV